MKIKPKKLSATQTILYDKMKKEINEISNNINKSENPNARETAIEGLRFSLFLEDKRTQIMNLLDDQNIFIDIALFAILLNSAIASCLTNIQKKRERVEDFLRLPNGQDLFLKMQKGLFDEIDIKILCLIGNMFSDDEFREKLKAEYPLDDLEKLINEKLTKN